MSEEQYLKVIRDWKHAWMNQYQNGQADHDNYFNRAFGIDSNMVHSLAKRLVEAENTVTNMQGNGE
jgi:hypothetical protein